MAVTAQSVPILKDNYAWLLRRVDELGYDGWVGCEYRPLRGTAEGLAWRNRLLV